MIEMRQTLGQTMSDSSYVKGASKVIEYLQKSQPKSQHDAEFLTWW